MLRRGTLRPIMLRDLDEHQVIHPMPDVAIDLFRHGYSTSMTVALDSVYEYFGSDKLRCYLVTSAGELLVYQDDVPFAGLHVVDINDLDEIHPLADPEREIDQYVADTLERIIRLGGSGVSPGRRLE